MCSGTGSRRHRRRWRRPSVPRGQRRRRHPGPDESSKGNTAANAVDGATTTRWCASNGNTGHWLEVDLGAARSLTGARIAWELDATNYRYRIEGSTDNATSRGG
ncbi:discoidin domain-containing protein [Streptomyces sp. NPDC101112]|uniref:discoidin domain-containing protein n=1 Tax=Streptomyces sp. NPDC101112 TaxID=3366105 RepID=UPI00211E8FCF